MVILGRVAAMRSGVPYSISLSLPILVCGVLSVGAFVALVLVALRTKENVQAGLRLRPWSITFFLDAQNEKCKMQKSEGEHASKDDEFASKP
jgi:hypothetical protein